MWQRRSDAAQEERTRLRATIEHETGSLVRDLHRILDVLVDLDYLEPSTFAPTDLGRVLAGVYSEVDLLVAEILRVGVLDGLDAAELAGVAAFLLHVPRRSEPTARPEVPSAPLVTCLAAIEDVAEGLRVRERAAGLSPLRILDAGFVGPAWRWARGSSLDDALGSLDLTGGDFVRDVKQAVDLLGQIANVARGPLRSTAQDAVTAMRRGIVEA